jgi:ribosomal protein S18 acetylase RimI-like enzyme
MDSTVKIEQMSEKNLEEVAELFNTVFNEVGEKWSIETALEHVIQNYSGGAHWIAVKEGEIIGFLMGITMTREPGLELFIDSLAVNKNNRRQGIGKRLWEEAQKYVKEKRLAGIRLMANPNVQSFNWYKKMGFIESGWIEVFKTESEDV